LDKSVDLQVFSDKKDDEGHSNDNDVSIRNREHLKRKAKEMRNSKYDESFLVDYSENRTKFLKHSDLDMKAQTSSSKQNNFHAYYHKSGNTTTGKLNSSLPQQSKRLQK
jgi:hypothetical protein